MTTTSHPERRAIPYRLRDDDRGHQTWYEFSVDVFNPKRGNQASGSQLGYASERTVRVQTYGIEDMLGDGSDLLSSHHETMMPHSTNHDPDKP